MQIHHVALWVENLERAKQFYTKYFNGVASSMYRNEKTGFTSHFIQFEQGTRIELMHVDDLVDNPITPRGFSLGIAHLSFGIETKLMLEALTNRLRSDGFAIAGEPRITGDGYYESVILDPENNRVELVSIT